jgi:hypothetical protein
MQKRNDNAHTNGKTSEQDGDSRSTATVKRFYDLFKKRDIQAGLAMFADNAVMYGPAPAGVLPWGGEHRGKEGVAQFFKSLGQSLEPQQFDLYEYITQGDKVVVLGYQKGLAKPTGKPYEIEFVHVWTVQDGKLAEFRVYNDTAALVDALAG